MEVNADVMNVNGMMLFGQGAILTERHIRMLKTWGIEVIDIVGSEPEGSTDSTAEPLAPEICAKIEQELKFRFKHVNLELPIARQIWELAKIRLERNPHGEQGL